MLTAREFASELSTGLALQRDKKDQPWTGVMAKLLGKIGEQYGLVTYGHAAGAARRHREYLWDYTMYADRRDGALPVAVIEHENKYDFDAFRDDFWKTLMAIAPLQVAIGYCRRAEERAEWVARINDEAATGVWDATFLGANEGLIALGFDGMLEGDGNFLCWVRADRSKQWLAYPQPQ